MIIKDTFAIVVWKSLPLDPMSGDLILPMIEFLAREAMNTKTKSISS